MTNTKITKSTKAAERAKSALNMAEAATGRWSDGLTVLEQLGYIEAARHDLELAAEYAVEQAREQGVTWAAIALELQITRQAAQQRYSSRSINR
jgi:hypothetical protein